MQSNSSSSLPTQKRQTRSRKSRIRPAMGTIFTLICTRISMTQIRPRVRGLRLATVSIEGWRIRSPKTLSACTVRSFTARRRLRSCTCARSIKRAQSRRSREGLASASTISSKSRSLCPWLTTAKRSRKQLSSCSKSSSRLQEVVLIPSRCSNSMLYHLSSLQ